MLQSKGMEKEFLLNKERELVIWESKAKEDYQIIPGLECGPFPENPCFGVWV